MKKKTETASTEPEPLLPPGHSFVLLPDGRVAKLCRTYPIGRKDYVNIRAGGRNMRLSVERLQAFLSTENR